MKHIFATLLLIVALPLLAQTQDCIIPVVYKTDVEPHTNNNESEIIAPFIQFLKSQGFTSDIKNTRLAITLVPKVSSQDSLYNPLRMDIEIRLTDVNTEATLSSWQLDTFFCGHYSFNRSYSANLPVYSNVGNWDTPYFSAQSPVCSRIVYLIRNKAIQIFEDNTQDITRLALDYANKDNHKIALFTLVQYPICCPSYSKITDCMISVYSDYVKKNHKILLDEAKRVWNSSSTDAEARFIVSLLNSETLDEGEQRKADRLLKKVAKAYPSVDIKAHEAYSLVPELKAVAILRARTIGIDSSIYQ